MKINKYTFKNNTIAQKGETNKQTNTQPSQLMQ